MNPSIGRSCVLLTGATGQLGDALIDSLATDFDIIALTRSSTPLIPRITTETFDPINGLTQTRPVQEIFCDLTDHCKLISTIATVSALAPRIDHVINCAGDGRFLGNMVDAHSFADGSMDQFRLHVMAPAIICSVLFHSKWKYLPTEGRNLSITNISSMAGLKLFYGSGQGMYAASKAAENMMTVHMASDYGRYGIRVNAICPNSFPQIVSVESVVSVIISAINSRSTGQLFKIDAQS